MTTSVDVFSKITLEKRLGMAQLCLLLMVLVFMTFTRGANLGTLLFDGPSVPKDSVYNGSRRSLLWRANGFLRANSEPEKPSLPRMSHLPSVE